MRKQNQENIKKRSLGPKGLASNHYGVVAAIETQWPTHPIKHTTAIQQMKQAFADLKRIRPEYAHSEVVIDMPSTLRFKLIVPATRQGAFDLRGSEKVSSDASQVIHAAEIGTIEATALAEAEQLAAAAARVSMSAVDVGGKVVRQVERGNVSLEDAAEEFAKSLDEVVSRQTYARAAGPAQTIQFAQLGERTLGGSHIVSADLHSSDTFSLRGCRLLPGGRDGGFLLEGNPEDSEWNRLTTSHPNCNVLSGDKDGYVMQLLVFAMASDLPVDINVCLSERVRNKRRRLVPLLVHNLHEIIGCVRERLELIEEEYR